MFNPTVKRSLFNLLVALCFVYHLVLLTVNLTYQVTQCFSPLIPVVRSVVQPSTFVPVVVPLTTITRNVLSDLLIVSLPTGDQPITLSTAQLNDHSLRFVDPHPRTIVVPSALRAG